MIKKLPKKPLYVVLLCVALTCFVTLSLFAVKFSSIFYILIGAGISLFAYAVTLVMDKKNKGGNEQ